LIVGYLDCRDKLSYIARIYWMSTPGSRPPGAAASRAALIEQTTVEVRRQQIAYDRFHDAVAAYLGLNRTDIRCLDILDLNGRQTAGSLATAMGMSTGAVTAMLDRLERSGYVRRLRDPDDRRRVLVEPAELAAERGREIYGPFAEQTGPMFSRFTDAELTLIRDFLRLGSSFYEVQIDRIERLARRGSRASGEAGVRGGAPGRGKIGEDRGRVGEDREKIGEDLGSGEDLVHPSPPNPPASPDPPRKSGQDPIG
jgi:DNA-binding MarR family transcriptional regulator